MMSLSKGKAGPVAALLACAALVMALPACGDDAGPEPVAQASPSATEAASPDPAKTDGHGGWHAKGGDDKKSDAKGPEKKGPGRGSSPAPGDGGGPGGGSGGPSGGGSDGSTAGGEETRSPDRRPSRSGTRRASHPAAGDFVYSQEGFEEFCNAGCERRRLPRTQRLSVAVRRQGDGWVVVTTARASRGRMVRTTLAYTSSGATVERVFLRYSYGGFTFDETYDPQPAVHSLRFPLTEGERWSGSWSGDVSGDYAVAVGGREKVAAGGREVRAVRVSTRTRFRGDFQGSANGTAWIDPSTLAVVATAGNVSVESSFGRYTSGFETHLRSGPGY